MKTLKCTFLCMALYCFTLFAYAQQRYLVHVDYVKPNKYEDYMKVAKEFTKACNEHQPNASWITISTSDDRFLYVSPMKNFAELDTNVFGDMAEKMGDDFGKMFKQFDACYDKHADYVLVLNEDLSYMPEGLSQTQEGENYRKYYVLYHTPSNHESIKEAIKGVKKLYQDKSSKEYYRIYHSGFGTDEDYYLVAVSSKDPVDAATKSKVNDELLGEDAGAVFSNLMKSTERFEEFSGWMRTDLFYSPKQ
ncbi:MAG: hypothetical protein KDD20_06650 [Mangrovimonas sp.]|nr:hypothetical protein [Mangrovimonas sp.]HPF97726.1 hypothetical protein [Mangrovimonas sp.]HRV54934.1 hypothetical protein [Mangrovimonas sp.]